MKITVETNVAAPIEAVWDAYTTPADIKQWNAASADWHTTTATVDLREGGLRNPPQRGRGRLRRRLGRLVEQTLDRGGVQSSEHEAALAGQIILVGLGPFFRREQVPLRLDQLIGDGAPLRQRGVGPRCSSEDRFSLGAIGPPALLRERNRRALGGEGDDVAAFDILEGQCRTGAETQGQAGEQNETLFHSTYPR